MENKTEKKFVENGNLTNLAKPKSSETLSKTSQHSKSFTFVLSIVISSGTLVWMFFKKKFGKFSKNQEIWQNLAT